MILAEKENKIGGPVASITKEMTMGLTRASKARAKKGFNVAKLILNLIRAILNFDIRHELHMTCGQDNFPFPCGGRRRKRVCLVADVSRLEGGVFNSKRQE